MTQLQVVEMAETWQHWDGRIVCGKFPLLQYLGGSEHSVVYLTEVQGASVAIKLVATNSPQAKNQVASWKLASRLSHPNLVRIIDTGLWHADDQQDMQFAVMEYCEESLAGVLRQRPLTSAETREMLVPTLDALNYLHTQGLAHGEVTPANILAQADQIKLSTDGLRRTSEKDDSGVIGPYDAPEKTQGTISPSGDLWSLGITLVEALTNRLPARDKSGKVELTEQLPAPFDSITKGCLAYDRERRLSIAEIRKLLDVPAAESKADTRLVVPSQTPVVTKREPTSSSEAPLPVRNLSSAARSSSPADAVNILADPAKRRLAIIAASALVILAIVIGLLVRRNSSQAPQPATATVAQPDNASNPPAATTATPSAAKPSASTPAPGAVLHEVMPEVSSQARNTIHGTVKVGIKVAVDPQGKVSQAMLASGSSRYFSNQALQASRQWSFVAPTHDGKPQPSTWTLTFEFRRSGTKVNARRTSHS